MQLCRERSEGGSINPATGEGRDLRESSQKRKHLSQTLNKGKSSGTRGEEPVCQCRRHKRWGFGAWVGKIPWRRAWQPTPVFLPGDPMDRGAWQGRAPGGHKELDMAERLSRHKSSPRPKGHKSLQGLPGQRLHLEWLGTGYCLQVLKPESKATVCAVASSLWRLEGGGGRPRVRPESPSSFLLVPSSGRPGSTPHGCSPHVCASCLNVLFL